MKRSLILGCALGALTLLSGCVGYYAPKAGTPDEELRANVSAAEAAKQERLK